MWELLWQLAIFFLGISIGKVRATNTDITNQTSYMQNLINQAYEERENYRIIALNAEQEAESWKRRYDSLLEDIYSKEDEEEEVGS